MLNDVAITSMARKIVTRNWLDISRLRIRTVRGVIHMQGRIIKLSGGPDDREGDESGMRKLDEDLRVISGVRGVNYQLENWVSVSAGTWRKLHVKMSEAARQAILDGNKDIG